MRELGGRDGAFGDTQLICEVGCFELFYLFILYLWNRPLTGFRNIKTWFLYYSLHIFCVIKMLCSSTPAS